MVLAVDAANRPTPDNGARFQANDVGLPSHVPAYEKENSETQLTVSDGAENVDKWLKCKVKLTKIQVEFGTDVCNLSRNSSKSAQLRVNVERLSIANRNHRKAIQNLRKPVVALRKLGSKLIEKLDREGLVKMNSVLLRPWLPHPQKAKYSKKDRRFGERRVVLIKDKFTKRFFYNALRRGSNIVDKEKILKYQCPTCPYKTYAFNGLSKHHFSSHGFTLNYTLTCPDCNFTARHPCAMTRHRQKHKKEPDLSCPHCPYVTRFDCSLRIHLRKWHLPAKEAKTLRCPYCNFVSISKTAFNAHIMVHLKGGENHLARFVHNSTNINEVEILQCEYCNFKSPVKNLLRRHIQQTHKIENAFERQPYRCKVCGFDTKHRFSFRDHMLLHESTEDVSLLQCYDCGFKTKWKKYLTLHMRLEHRKAEQQEKVYYHCPECSKMFAAKYSLKKHIFQRHRVSEVLMCHDCNFRTNTMTAMRRHVLARHINPKIKIFKCQKCFHISEDRAQHRAHLKTHKYECDKCDFKTLRKDALRYHIVGHMSKEIQKEVVEMHKCQLCDYETRNKLHYERHQMRWRHYSDKPLKSRQCCNIAAVTTKVTIGTDKAGEVDLKSENL